MKHLIALVMLLAACVGVSAQTQGIARRVISNVSGGSGVPTVSVTRTNAPATGAASAQGVDVAISGSDDLIDFGGFRPARFTSTWTGTGSANHQTMFGVVSTTAHNGTGRIDTANGFNSGISNGGGGILQEPHNFYGQIMNSGGSIGQGSIYYADWAAFNTGAVSTYASLFEGKFRHISGTPNTLAAYGLYLHGWTKAGGSTVTTSAGIEIDSSIDIGTTAWAIHSTSASPSLLSGALSVSGTLSARNAANPSFSAGTAGTQALSVDSGPFVVIGTGLKFSNLADSGNAPTISSGFGTSPSVTTSNGTIAFTINVGTGGTATNGVIGLPTAANGWACSGDDLTTQSTTVFVLKQIASSTTTATIANYNTAGAQAAWVASDILSIQCRAR